MRSSADCEKMEEMLLPGFRFHPTDEELVLFYLKRKIQQRPLSIELIRQLDIYKYDPWDLPKLASTGEKEWYFYCPRDRKYKNSTRPNRVTGAGFWKATGTDRPIYSSEGGSKCIGLKKSLVFYKGRAAKGVKTDWMMHEFRLPTLADMAPPKRSPGKANIPPNDAWAICKIFKKASSAVQRSISHSWVSPLPVNLANLPDKQHSLNQHANPDNTSLTTNSNASSSVFHTSLSEGKYISNLDLISSSSRSRILFPALMTGSGHQNLNPSLLCSFNMLSSPSPPTAEGSLKPSPPYLSLVDHVYNSSMDSGGPNNVAGDIGGVVKTDNCNGQWETAVPNGLPSMHSWELASSSCSGEYPASYI